MTETTHASQRVDIWRLKTENSTMIPLRTQHSPGRLAFLATLALCSATYAAPPAFLTIHVFSSLADGNSPRAGLVLAPSGMAYGTTLFGGSSNSGTVYQLTPVSGTEKWSESVIYNFAGSPDGANPAGSLILGTGGVLYGTTIAGGSANAGTVFQLTPPSVPGGAWTETVVYNFAGAPDGAAPHAGLLLGAGGALYGTTAEGGAVSAACASGCGTIFALTPPPSPGAAWTETVLHAFAGADGANPFASLVAGPGGLYGTAPNGGSSGFGVVFALTAGGTIKVVHNFSGGADGANPYAPLTVNTATGTLYGAAENGGASAMGTVFALTSTGKFAVLHSFTGPTDGANPVAGLLLANKNTTLFGAASLGGASGDGTLFAVQLKSPATAFKVLHTFNGAMQSANPLATLILAPSAALLGTAEPQQVLDGVVPASGNGGSAYSFCTKNPPACAN
jgi:uncharacterized repeat protein (TIGR03803 family)